MQGHGVDAQQPGEIGDLLHLLSRAARVAGGTKPDRAGHRGDVGVAFALETAEDHADADAQFFEPGQELVGMPFRAGRLVRGVEMDRRDAQLVGNFQFHTQSGVDAGKDT